MPAKKISGAKRIFRIEIKANILPLNHCNVQTRKLKLLTSRIISTSSVLLMIFILLISPVAEMLEMRQSRASELKRLCERSEQLKESDVQELRADIKVCDMNLFHTRQHHTSTGPAKQNISLKVEKRSFQFSNCFLLTNKDLFQH